MATPAWKGATAGSQPLAGQINQFLGAHAATFVYTGAEKDNQSTAGAGSTSTNGLYIAQAVTAGSSYTAGRVVLTLSSTGSPTPATVAVYTNSGGAPGTILAGPLTVPLEYVPGSAAALSLPLSWALVNATTYWIVISAVGGVGNLYSWSKSNQASGTSTSANGSTWAAQTYGSLFQVWDNTTVLPLAHTYEDSGARWTRLTWTATSEPNTLQEYTVAQGSNQYVYSSRAFAYSNGLPASVT